MSDSLRPHGLDPARLLCPWNSPGKNTGVGCHFLLQGFLFCILVFWPQDMWDLGSLTRDRTHTPHTERSLNHWTTREVTLFILLLNEHCLNTYSARGWDYKDEQNLENILRRLTIKCSEIIMTSVVDSVKLWFHLKCSGVFLFLFQLR